MDAFLVRLVEVSRRHAAWVTLLFVLLALAGGTYTIRNISIDTDIDKLISGDLPWRQREREMTRAFPQNNDRLAIVVDAKTSDLASDASETLRARLAAMPNLFKSVRAPEGGSFFRHEGMLFLPIEEVQNAADQLIAAQPLIGTLAADPSLRGIFAALELFAQAALAGAVKESAFDAPLAAVADSTESALKGRYDPISWRGLFSSRKPDPRELRRFVLAQPILDFRALEPGAAARQAIRDAANALGLAPDRGVEVGVTGPVAFSDDQLATLSQGAGVSAALSLGLLCFWLLLGLRSLRLVAAIIVTLIVGLVGCATFAVGLVGPLNPISASFAVLFIGIAIDFGIQFSVRYRDERYRSNDLTAALRGTARGIGRPLVIAAAATAVGFLAFVPTDYTGVSDLGLIAGFGMLVALVLNLTLLPALLTLLRPRGEPHPVGYARAAAVDRFLVRRRGWVLTLGGLIALGSLALMPWLSFDFNPLDLQNQHTEAMRVLAELKSDPTSTPYTAEILTPSLDAATALAARLKSVPEVGAIITAATFVPSDQAAKIAILTDAKTLFGPTLSPATKKPAPSDAEILAAIAACAKDMNELGAKGDATASRLARALEAIAAQADARLAALKENLSESLERRLDDMRQALEATPVTLETLPADIRDDWIAKDGRARVEVFPKAGAPDNETLRRFVRAVLAVAPDATGTPVTIQESAKTVSRAFTIAGTIALVAIALLLFVILRRPGDVALVLAPLALAGLMTLATSVLVDLPLNFANIITLPLLLGIGVAFDIYFVMRWRGGDDDLLQSSTARAILFSALTTGTAFGSLALSANQGISEMGKLLTIALAHTLFCTFIILPALLGPARRAAPGSSATASAPAER